MSTDSQVSAGFTETNVQLLALRNIMTGGASDLSGFNGTATASIVDIANEILVIAQSGAGVILDTADNTVIDKTYSAQKISQLLATAKQEAKDELIDGADNSFDTFLEVFNEVTQNGGNISTALAGIASNTGLITLAQNVADNALAAANAADAKAVQAQATADTATSDIAALTAAVGPTNTDYAALVSAGL